MFGHKTIQIARIERCGNCSLNSYLDEQESDRGNFEISVAKKDDGIISSCFDLSCSWRMHSG